MEQYYELLEAVTAGTDSSLLLFIVIVAGLVLPLYVLMIKDRKYSRQHDSDKHSRYLEREREIISVMREISAVVAENTSVVASIKPLLQDQGTSVKHGLERIHGRIDTSLTDTAEIKATTTAILSILNGNQNTREE